MPNASARLLEHQAPAPQHQSQLPLQALRHKSQFQLHAFQQHQAVQRKGWQPQRQQSQAAHNQQQLLQRFHVQLQLQKLTPRTLKRSTTTCEEGWEEEMQSQEDLVQGDEDIGRLGFSPDSNAILRPRPLEAKAAPKQFNGMRFQIPQSTAILFHRGRPFQSSPISYPFGIYVHRMEGGVGVRGLTIYS